MKVAFLGARNEIQVDCAAPHKQKLERVEKTAYKRALSSNHGSGTWWKFNFNADSEVPYGRDAHFLRSLSEHKRYDGTWKLSNEILLGFTQSDPPGASTLTPKFQTKTMFWIHSPGYGPYGEFLATEHAAFIRAVITFVSGTTLRDWARPHPVSEDEKLQIVDSIARDEVLELFIDDIVLWQQLAPLLGMEDLDASEAFQRVRGALFAYEQALLQRSEFVTIILLVAAIEALAVPNATWRKNKVTKRFKEFVLVACPETVTEVMNHPHFEQAFGHCANPSQFLDRLYDLRSTPLHTGMVAHASNNLSVMAEATSARIYLVSTLTRAVIMAFLRCPFSSLVGHPRLSPIP